MDLIEGSRPRTRRRVVADDKHGRAVRVCGLSDQHHRILDLTELRAPQRVREERELAVGPQVGVKDLSSSLVFNPYNNPPALTMEALEERRKLARAFLGGQVV